MKVTIKNENKSTEIKYPCLMSADDGELFLIINRGIGVVISDTKGRCGYYSTGWDMSSLTPFTGTIELSND